MPPATAATEHTPLPHETHTHTHTHAPFQASPQEPRAARLACRLSPERSLQPSLSSTVQLAHQGSPEAAAALPAACPSVTVASVSHSSRSTCGLSSPAGRRRGGNGELMGGWMVMSWGGVRRAGRATKAGANGNCCCTCCREESASAFRTLPLVPAGSSRSTPSAPSGHTSQQVVLRLHFLKGRQARCLVALPQRRQAACMGGATAGPVARGGGGVQRCALRRGSGQPAGAVLAPPAPMLRSSIEEGPPVLKRSCGLRSARQHLYCRPAPQMHSWTGRAAGV